MFISSAFAQTAPAAAGGGDMMSSLASMLPLLLMFVVLYFVMIRPQMKKQKEHRAMIEALAKGDEVVTAGGLLGRVSKIGDGFIGVELAEGVEVADAACLCGAGDAQGHDEVKRPGPRSIAPAREPAHAHPCSGPGLPPERLVAKAPP